MPILHSYAIRRQQCQLSKHEEKIQNNMCSKEEVELKDETLIPANASIRTGCSFESSSPIPS